MQDSMNTLSQLVVWILFFAASVYGHVGFKLATQSGISGVWNTLFSFWGLTAALSWCVSAVLWIAILSRSTLFSANTVSALSHALIVIVAVFFFKETMTFRQMFGVLLVVAGIYFVTR